jgi:hypothetical protein
MYLRKIFISIMLVLSLFLFRQEKRALIFGNGNYAHTTPLINPSNDARDLAKVLEQLDFEVQLALDMDLRTMLREIGRFENSLQKGDLGLFYYAGHAVQVNNQNFLIPVDFDQVSMLGEEDLPYFALDVNRVMRGMANKNAAYRLLILDACRDNPFAERSRSMGNSGSRGLSVIGLDGGTTTGGSFIAYATSPGDTAADGDERNSPFTAALIEHMQTPNLDLEALFREVKRSVIDKTGGKQRPWTQNDLLDALVLNDRPEAVQKGINPTVELELQITDALAGSDWQKAQDLIELGLAQNLLTAARAGELRVKIEQRQEEEVRITFDRPTAMDNYQLQVFIPVDDGQGIHSRLFRQHLVVKSPNGLVLPFFAENVGDGILLWVKAFQKGTMDLELVFDSSRQWVNGDPREVFLFWEDFSGEELERDIWDYQSVERFGPKLALRAGDPGRAEIRSKQAFTGPLIMEFDAQYIGDFGGQGNMLAGMEGSFQEFFFREGSLRRNKIVEEEEWSLATYMKGGPFATQYHNPTRIGITKASGFYHKLIWGEESMGFTLVSGDGQDEYSQTHPESFNGAMNIYFRVRDWDKGFPRMKMNVDYIRIREFMPEEPKANIP